MKSYNEKSDEEYFLKVHAHNPVKLQEVYNDLPFLLKEWKLKESKSLQLIYMIKPKMSFT